MFCLVCAYFSVGVKLKLLIYFYAPISGSGEKSKKHWVHFSADNRFDLLRFIKNFISLNKIKMNALDNPFLYGFMNENAENPMLKKYPRKLMFANLI